MTREEAIAYGNDYYRDLMSACCKIDEKHKEFVRMSLEALEQEPKTGHWIKKGNTLTCPICGAVGEDIKSDYCFNYCPNCGAKMESEEEEHESTRTLH